MQELIRVESREIGNHVIQAVDARKLHKALKVNERFNDWVSRYLIKFVENKDYVCYWSNSSKKGRGGHNRKDYAFSLDMAKHVAMMAETEKGRAVRQYFIDTERAYIEALKSDGDKRRLRHKAASTNKLQNSILQLKRSEQGKPTRFFHYANEARLVNQVLTGDWSGIDRDNLTQAQLDKLAKLEEYNTVLIAQDIEFTPRRFLLRAYADGLGTYSALN
jgi:phage anti-repressor protein